MSLFVWEQDVAQRVAVFGSGEPTCHTSSQHSVWREKGGKVVSCAPSVRLRSKGKLSPYVCGWILVFTETTTTTTNGAAMYVYICLLYITGMRKRSFSLPDSLSLQPSEPRRRGSALVSRSYCYEFSIVIRRLHRCHKAGWIARMAIDVTLCCLQGI